MKNRNNYRPKILLLLSFFIGTYFGVEYLFENRSDYSVILFGVVFLVFFFATHTLFRDLIYKDYIKMYDYKNVAIIQVLFLLLIMLISSFINDGVVLNNFITFIIVSIIVIFMLVYIRKDVKKVKIDKPRKVKTKYKPGKDVFFKKTDEYINEYQDDYCSLLKKVLDNSIERELLEFLPVKIVNRFHTFRKNKPSVHYEGVIKDLWFQISFSEEGLLLMFDGFVPNSKYQPDEYFDLDSFESLNDMYAFIIEAFDYYHKRVMDDDLDTNEKFIDYFNKN